VEDFLRPNQLLNYQIPTLDGFGSFIPVRHALFLQLLRQEAGKPRLAKLLAAAAVRFTIYAPATHDPEFVSPFAFRLMDSGAPASPFAGPDFVSIWQSGESRIYRNTRALPRAYTVDEVRSVRSRDDASLALAQVEVDPTRLAVVEGEVGLPPPPSASTTPRIQWSRDEPLDIQLAISTDHPTFLVLADLWYPAWRAEVDGIPSAIYPTDVMFRGLAIPAGRHFVHFSFSLAPLIAGCIVTSATVLTIVVWIVLEIVCRPGPSSWTSTFPRRYGVDPFSWTPEDWGNAPREEST
jgi:hypothetical protein